MIAIEPIPVIRASYLNHFMDALKHSSQYGEASLEQFNLPTGLSNKPDAYVPLKACLEFMQWGASKTNSEDPGLRAGSQLTIADFSDELRNNLLHCSTLESALEIFCKIANREQSHVRYWLVQEQDDIRICSSFDGLSTAENSRQGEWIQIMSLITLIRYYIDDLWTPDSITLQSQGNTSHYAKEIFPQITLRTGQPYTSIVFPAALLNLAITENYRHQAVTSMPGRETHVAADFPTSLRYILQAYLDDGYPDIKFAARLINISVRTLQRRLERFNISYTDLVQQARFDLATNLLKDPSMKVIDAAYAVGYNDPSHFARAFRRLFGVTPQQYRTHNYAAFFPDNSFIKKLTNTPIEEMSLIPLKI